MRLTILYSQQSSNQQQFAAFPHKCRHFLPQLQPPMYSLSIQGFQMTLPTSSLPRTSSADLPRELCGDRCLADDGANNEFYHSRLRHCVPMSANV